MTILAFLAGLLTTPAIVGAMVIACYIRGLWVGWAFRRKLKEAAATLEEREPEPVSVWKWFAQNGGTD